MVSTVTTVLQRVKRHHTANVVFGCLIPLLNHVSLSPCTAQTHELLPSLLIFAQARLCYSA